MSACCSEGRRPPHVWYFTPENLRRGVEQAGLENTSTLRLDTLSLDGLWRHIRADRASPLGMSLASFLFAWTVYPLIQVFPSDATACFFRRRDVGDALSGAAE